MAISVPYGPVRSTESGCHVNSGISDGFTGGKGKLAFVAYCYRFFYHAVGLGKQYSPISLTLPVDLT